MIMTDEYLAASPHCILVTIWILEAGHWVVVAAVVAHCVLLHGHQPEHQL